MNRNLAPTYMQPSELPLTFPEEIVLQNGVRLFWFSDVKDDSVKLDIEWSAGTKYQDKKLVASFTNKLLMSGYDGKTASQIAEEIDFYGGYVQRELDKDHAGLTVYGLKENIGDIFGVLSDALLNCTFPQAEFEKEHAITFSQFKIDSEKVKNQCRREFSRNLFGTTSPYGDVAVTEDFERVERDDLHVFYKEAYLHTLPTIFLVGDVSPDFIRQLEHFSGNFNATAALKEFPRPEQNLGEFRLWQDKGSLQSAIRVGRLVMMKDHPDYFGFQVLNTIIGGYFGSRLMTNIREEKGYTYGIGSGVAVLADAAYFFISTEVGEGVKEETLKEIFIELDRLKTETVSIDELSRVKNYMLGNFLRQSDGPIQMMENFKNIYFNDLDKMYYADFIQAIHALQPHDIVRLANYYLKKEDMTIVVAG
jgi:zinc protease